MTQVTIDNDPVSIQLNPGESTTVPTGEVWDVTATFATVDDNSGDAGGLQVNGKTVIGGRDSGASVGQVADMVFKGGDTISVASGVGGSVSGWVVDK